MGKKLLEVVFINYLRSNRFIKIKNAFSAFQGVLIFTAVVKKKLKEERGLQMITVLSLVLNSEKCRVSCNYLRSNRFIKI